MSKGVSRVSGLAITSTAIDASSLSSSPANLFSRETALTDKSQFNKDRFIYPTGRYWGEFTPENLAFNANLQEFANRVSVICALETGGKITPKEAYNQIKDLWRQLRESKKALLRDRPDPPEPPED